MTTLSAMPKYEAYKDSGVEWIGEIPIHWELKKLKFISFINKQSLPENTSRNLTLEYVDIGSVTLEKGIEKVESFSFSDAPSRARRMANEGDTVVSTVRTYLKAIAYVDDISSKYIYSTGFAVITPKCLKFSKYLTSFIKSDAFTKQVDDVAKGMSYPAINSTDLSNLFIAEPPESEHIAIATFLDEKTAKIDEAIAIKEKQIELLKERKQIIIQQAVTQGLDPTVPMKDSGVEWIGKIPAHWKVVKLKYLSTQIVDGTHFTPTYVDQGIPFLRVTDLSNMIDGKINWQDVCYIPEKEHKMLIKRAKGEIGDVLISKNGTIGLTKVIDWKEEFSFFVSLCLIKLRKEISPYYFTSFFNSPIVDQQITFGSSKTSVTNLHLEKIKELLVILPPLNEQNDIDEYVKTNSKDLDVVICNLLQQIEKLKEYKTTLINSAVTGKIKVV